MHQLKDLAPIIEIGKKVYQQDINGIHGLNHWHRVYNNGMLVGKAENAHLRIVGLFAFLHDCKRENENIDPDHGLRAADFIKTLDLDILRISQAERETLCYACIYHNKGKISDDPTIGTCWDADRLDLMRVSIYPDSDYLSTKTAKPQDIIDHCVEQSLLA